MLSVVAVNEESKRSESLEMAGGERQCVVVQRNTLKQNENLAGRRVAEQ